MVCTIFTTLFKFYKPDVTCNLYPSFSNCSISLYQNYKYKRQRNPPISPIYQWDYKTHWKEHKYIKRWLFIENILHLQISAPYQTSYTNLEKTFDNRNLSLYLIHLAVQQNKNYDAITQTTTLLLSHAVWDLHQFFYIKLNNFTHLNFPPFNTILLCP